MITDAGIKGTETPMWAVNPFDPIAKIWKQLVEGSALGYPHVVGTLKIMGNTVVDIEMHVVLHSRKRKVVLREENSIHFLFPVHPEDGPEGVYLTLLDAVVGRV